MGSTVNSLDNTVSLKGVVEAHQDIQVKVTVNDTDYTASVDNDTGNWHVSGFAPIFPDTCYHLTHYWPAAADIPV
ncbi:hypothetical protein H1B43_22580, partial [Salmonella enterica subsp. enterica serovar Indiana]|nr:hypothetical protein [Salmonella enterica subsp. enterica serovar Indiana]